MANPIEIAKTNVAEKARRVLALRLRSYTLAQIDPEAARRDADRAHGNDSEERAHAQVWYSKRAFTLGDALTSVREAVSPVVRTGSSLVIESMEAAASRMQRMLTTFKGS